MVELDPSKKELDVQKASVVISNDGTKAIVKFNIFQKEPPIPVGGGVRVYDIVRDQKQCITQTVESRIDSAECQGILSKNQIEKCTPWRAGLGPACEGVFETHEKQMACYKETSTGLGCLWL